MKHITEELGKTLLDLLVAGLLITYLFVTIEDDAGNRGVLQIMGANIQEAGTDYGSYCDFDVYEAEAEKDAPVLSRRASVPVSPGIYRITEDIRAVDYGGQEIPVKLVRAWGIHGEELTVQYQTDTAGVEFSQPGIYTVLVYAVDDMHKKTVCRVKIPVNRQGGVH